MSERASGYIAAISLAAIYLVGALSEFGWVLQGMAMNNWKPDDWGYAIPALLVGVVDVVVALFIWRNAPVFAEHPPSDPPKRPLISPDALRTTLLLVATLLLFYNMPTVIGDVVPMARPAAQYADATANSWVGFLSAAGAILYLTQMYGQADREEPR